MASEDLIMNGGFETGSLSPWLGSGVTLATLPTHTGFYAVQLAGGGTNSYLYQMVPVTPGERYTLFLSLATNVMGTSPPLSVMLLYLDASYAFLGYGLTQYLPAGSLPNGGAGNWKSVYALSSPVPATGAYAILMVNQLPSVSSVPVLVDDVVLGTGGESVSSGVSFPLMAAKFQSLMGSSVTIYVGTIYATGAVAEVTDEYVRIIDANGVSDLFPFQTLSVAEYT